MNQLFFGLLRCRAALPASMDQRNASSSGKGKNCVLTDFPWRESHRSGRRHVFNLQHIRAVEQQGVHSDKARAWMGAVEQLDHFDHGLAVHDIMFGGQTAVRKSPRPISPIAENTCRLQITHPSAGAFFCISSAPLRCRLLYVIVKLASPIAGKGHIS